MTTKTRKVVSTWSARLDTALLIGATVAMLAALALLAYTVLTQIQLYGAAASAALSHPREIDHAAVLAYARSGDFAAAKFMSLSLGFALIFLGAGYTLRVARAAYRATLKTGTVSNASLTSSSPGLVMVSFGVVLVALAVLTQSSVQLERPQAREVKFTVVEDKAD